MNQLERLGGTDRHTGRLSIRASLPAPEGRVEAQVAFGGFLLVRIPDCPARPLRAVLDTPFAADAFVLVNHPDIPVSGIDMRSADRTILNAQRRDALPADGHTDVERIFGERGGVADDLNPGQRGIRLPLVAG